MTVRFENFITFTRSHTPREPLSTENALYTGAVRLLLPLPDHRENPKQRNRLIGVRVEKPVRPAADKEPGGSGPCSRRHSGHGRADSTSVVP